MRAFLFLLVAVVPAPWSSVRAYPQFIAKGYTNCASCHYSPTGGGLLNSYGHATLEATFPDDVKVDFLERARKAIAKNDVSGYDDKKKAAFQWDLGVDTRFMFVSTATEGEEEEREDLGESIRAFPMLVEVGGVLAYGPLLLYGAITPRRAGPDSMPDTIFSREHWLSYRFGETTSLRAGRMVLPFGLRIADHTQYTREDLDLDMWGQSYGLEFDYVGTIWTASAAGYAGDLILDPTELQERGGVFSVGRNFPDRATVGVSFLGGASENVGRLAGSAFGRVRIWKTLYSMAEVSPHHRWGRKVDASQTGIASMARVGAFPIKSLDLFFEYGTRQISGEGDLTKRRYALAADWWVVPWIEVSPMFVMENDIETGTTYEGAVQLHAIF